MADFPDWFETGHSSQDLTHEQILKLARTKKVIVGLKRRQGQLRDKCEQLTEAGYLRRLNSRTYISSDRGSHASR